MYYTAGSDDFRAYVWKIPHEAVLLESRKVVEYSDWIKNRGPGELGTWSRFAVRVASLMLSPVQDIPPLLWGQDMFRKRYRDLLRA